MTAEEETKLIEEHVLRLGEFFDTVQIFCSRHDPAVKGGTVTVSDGSGNLYARYGQVQEWLLMQDEYSRIRARQSMNEPEEPQ